MTEPWSNASGGCGIRPLGIGKHGKEKLAEWKKCHAQAKEDNTTVGDKVFHGVKKVSFAAIRGSVLTSMRLNLFGVSRRLFPGFASEAQIKAEHIKPSSASKAKVAWQHISSMWKKMGGKESTLRKEITKGHRLHVQLFHGKNNFSGESYLYSNVAGVDDAVVAGWVTAGLPVVAAFVKHLSDSNTDKNPYEAGADPSGEGDNYDAAPNPTDVSNAEKHTGVSIENDTPVDTHDGTPLADDSGMPTWGWIGIGVGAIALVGFGLYITLRKK